VTPHEVSHQWWGHAVGWSTYHDQWLSEGFADFSTALFLEATNPKGDKALQFWKQARETLLEKNAYGRRANDAGPLWMGLRLDSPKNPGAYARVVYLKGAYVLQMLRSLMHDDKTGDKDFTEMLQDFVKTKMFQSATTEEFQAVAERHMKQRNFQENGKLDWFFAQWLYGTEIPRYALEYSIKTEADGQISFNGKLTQSEVSARFATMLPVYMDFDGRAVRVLTVPVVGSATREFSVKLPKKPKRVLLNVNYDVLCSDATVKETQ
jgi:aminopeptidase N